MPPVESFLPIWNAENQDELLEVYVVYDITSDQAKLMYAFDGEQDLVRRVEKWTPRYYENYLNGKLLANLSGPNPWGKIPLTYIPRVRTTDWFGDALTAEIIPAQNELNGRLADVAEAINYNAHPVRWGVNFPKVLQYQELPA